MKKNLSSILLVVAFFLGIGLLLYPSVSNYYNSFHQTTVINDYENDIKTLTPEESERLWAEAEKYNADVEKIDGYMMPNPEQKALYNRLLNISGGGVMGHIEIPIIQVSLPIYHGTDDSVLQNAVGHLDWSSLPTGNENTHCLLSGHRGLANAKLFTDLDRLREGDIFRLYILDRVLTYKVDKIITVEPDDLSRLRIIEGGDFCTLITCTPYGINTQRLLVRGQRITTLDNEHNSGDAVQVEPLVVAPVISAPFLFGLMLYVMIKYRNR